MSDHLKTCPFNVKFDGSSDPVKLCGMHVDGLDQVTDLTDKELLKDEEQVQEL